MPTTQKFIVNGKPVSVDVEDGVRLLWVLRDLLNVKGPKYGCGLNVCKACTSHINGKAFNPCAVQVGDLKPTDEITTIEGLADTVGKPLHPMQQAWLDNDVAQCGYCQPGQIMAAVALVKEIQAEGRAITQDDLDGLRNMCRCGTYYRIREAIQAGALAMASEGSAAPVSTTAVTHPANASATKKKKKATKHKVAAKRVVKPTQPSRTLAYTGNDPILAAGGGAAIAAAVIAARLRRGADEPATAAAPPVSTPEEPEI